MRFAPPELRRRRAERGEDALPGLRRGRRAPRLDAPLRLHPHLVARGELRLALLLRLEPLVRATRHQVRARVAERPDRLVALRRLPVQEVHAGAVEGVARRVRAPAPAALPVPPALAVASCCLASRCEPASSCSCTCARATPAASRSPAHTTRFRMDSLPSEFTPRLRILGGGGTARGQSARSPRRRGSGSEEAAEGEAREPRRETARDGERRGSRPRARRSPGRGARASRC